MPRKNTAPAPDRREALEAAIARHDAPEARRLASEIRQGLRNGADTLAQLALQALASPGEALEKAKQAFLEHFENDPLYAIRWKSDDVAAYAAAIREGYLDGFHRDLSAALAPEGERPEGARTLGEVRDAIRERRRRLTERALDALVDLNQTSSMAGAYADWCERAGMARAAKTLDEALGWLEQRERRQAELDAFDLEYQMLVDELAAEEAAP